MSEHGVSAGAAPRERALSFASVAEAYDRARPSYPAEAVPWLLGTGPATVLELGAGTGKLTELLLAAGHEVLATDPLPEMLALLRGRAPGARTAVATAERIPVPSRSVDVVVCAESFHWFDHAVALPEIARVLKPGGVLALVWNVRDEGIPWVRKLGRIIGSEMSTTELEEPAAHSEHFRDLVAEDFRFWQSLRRDELFDLVRSRSYVATLDEPTRDDVLARVGALYDDYGRGPDGMQLPYLTRCYRAVVEHQTQPPVVLSPVTTHEPGVRVDGAVLTDPDATQAIPRPTAPPEDPGTLLIDFR
ncbi:class I SAM-dependent methyltransferase [Marmoricola sp. RAF53]|uniref:class I SAM-dependent methyltransferase n=1 Tax=Marmoricola sp. RAF53 TaxID=3233059 RepID=UPI003F97EC7F